jgi:hypothetical protein
MPRYSSKSVYTALGFLALVMTTLLLFNHSGPRSSPASVSSTWTSNVQNASELDFGPNHSKYAYAVFLANSPADRQEPASEMADKFFEAVLILAYQLLHAPETKTHRNIPLIVLVTENVPERKRALLRKYARP